MSDCTDCVRWQVRHQIDYIKQLEKELDNLELSEQTYLLAAQVKAELEQVKEFDDFVKRHYGGNRTEAVREAMRRLIKEEEKQ
jgi:light-regulated signal transduction histidine kinase (bacteriophytochrome)